MLSLLLLLACQRDTGRVNSADYDAFWLWAGVTPQPVLDDAKTIYILQGEVRQSGRARIVGLRAATPKIRHATLWIVYRVETIKWGDDIVGQMTRDLERWRMNGNTVAGIQIDFDSATQELPLYTAFLKQLRSKLPPDCGLSITGLLDWSRGSKGDSDGLNPLAGVVDELVLQTYQGRHTILRYEAYMDGLKRLKLPFKIGLVQGGAWNAPRSLTTNPNFRGYVVFLLNPDT